jgi:hypothetical protein
MLTKPIVAVAILLASGLALAQRIDLGEMADQEMQELRLQQQQRLLDQQETQYDRETCRKVGYDGLDIEQCVLDSAYRRGISEAPPIVLDPPMPPPGPHCVTADTGDGIRDTTCD